MAISTPEPAPNPYAAPQAPLALAAADSRSWTQRIASEWQRGAWPLVFLLNLALPGIMAYSLCSPAGFGGVVLVTVFLLCMTSWLVAGNSLLRARFIVGGKIVAVFQCLLFFHVVIGYVSLLFLALIHYFAPQMYDANFHPLRILNFWPAAIVTLSTGSGLLALAYFIGKRQVSSAEETLLLSQARESL